jgi:DNA-binding NarL/FixJ family response regulator
MPALLLVEDHANLADILVRFLRRQESLDVCAVVHSGEAALERLPHLAVDLVLVDVSLPGMSGIDLVAAIRIQQPDLPCLVLSGHSEPAYVHGALESGARGYVAKGNPRTLLEAVQRVLDGETFLDPDLRVERDPDM